MNPRALPVLKIVTIVLIVAIAVIAALFVQFFLSRNAATTPRTELERAVYAAEEAVRANPESGDARIKLAAAYLESGAVEAAREQAQIATRIAPNDPNGYYILGLVESKAGNNAKAIELLRKAANTKGQLAGFYQDVWRAMSSAYERSGDTSEAIGAMNMALNQGPENAELLVNRGRLYESEKRWADALYDYSLAVQFSPDHKEAMDSVRRIAKAHPDALAEVKKKFEITPPGMDTSSTAK